MIDPEGTTIQAPETISINGVDYSLEEAQTLIETGKRTQEAETKWNTKLDNVWPEYGKLTQEQKNWEEQKKKYEEDLAKLQTKQELGTETAEDVAKAKEAARKLGITLNEDLEKNGYIKKEDLEKYLEERDTKQEAVRKVLAEADKLETEIDGSDGRPAFNKKVVLAYANSYGKSDLKEAYEEMNEKALKAWQEAQIEAKKGKSLKTLQPGGEKNPKQEKVTDDNVKDLLKEKLWGAQE